MTLLNIINPSDPILRRKAKKITRFDGTLQNLIDDMIETMHDAGGVGLAANQVGVPYRICVIGIPEEEEIRILINPEITDFGTTLNSYEEGCLSIPGVYLNVVRPSTIKLKFRDEMGRPRKMKADGLLARCIQHEMDHLNGILFVDRVTSKDDLNKELIKEGFNEKDVISIN